MNPYKQSLINLKAELEPVNTRYVKSGEYLKDLGLLGELVEKENNRTAEVKIKVDSSDVQKAIDRVKELRVYLKSLKGIFNERL